MHFVRLHFQKDEHNMHMSTAVRTKSLGGTVKNKRQTGNVIKDLQNNTTYVPIAHLSPSSDNIPRIKADGLRWAASSGLWDHGCIHTNTHTNFKDFIFK